MPPTDRGGTHVLHAMLLLLEGESGLARQGSPRACKANASGFARPRIVDPCPISEAYAIQHVDKRKSETGRDLTRDRVSCSDFELFVLLGGHPSEWRLRCSRVLSCGSVAREARARYFFLISELAKGTIFFLFIIYLRIRRIPHFA